MGMSRMVRVSTRPTRCYNGNSQRPEGEIQGSIECFRVARGVRQGCVLGPTLFIIVLEYCLRLTGTEGIGLQFRFLRGRVHQYRLIF
jgi:hypothetical protein